MAHPTEGEVGARHNRVFTALAHSRRRLVLTALDRLSAADPAELATHVVAAEAGEEPASVAPAATRPVRIALEHTHLPRLRQARLIYRSDGIVRKTDHPAFGDPKFDEILRVDDPGWDDVLASLAVRRRRIVLSTLHSHDEPMDRADLAFAVARTEQWGGHGESVECVIQDLHHVHLPELAATGLVSYDAGAGHVSYEGHPALDEQWVAAGNDDPPRAILSVATHSGDVWTLDGREHVAEHCRALSRVADEELFVLLADDRSLEEATLRRIAAAAERGVDVYLGTRDHEIADRVRSVAPAARVWEPAPEWPRLGPDGEGVARLVVADREAVVIGTHGQDGPGEVATESAITATGPDNPLVVLLRDLLGTRLDHLDAGTDDLRSEIPL